MKKKKVFKLIITRIGYCVFAFMHILMIWLSFHPEFCLEAEVLEQIFYVGAQIIAGLYGTILTGYVFLLSKIDSQAAINPCTEDVILSLKQKYKHMIFLISADVLFSFIGIGVSIFYRSGVLNIPEWIYWIVTNETLLFMGCVIVFIIYFVNRAIHPRRLEQAAMELKHHLDKGNVVLGDTKLFLELYIEIEKKCWNSAPGSLKGHLQKYSNGNSALIHRYIRQQHLYSADICNNLECLRKYHSCLLYGDDLTVSKYMCQLAEHTLKEMS